MNTYRCPWWLKCTRKGNKSQQVAVENFKGHARLHVDALTFLVKIFYEWGDPAQMLKTSTNWTLKSSSTSE